MVGGSALFFVTFGKDCCRWLSVQVYFALHRRRRSVAHSSLLPLSLVDMYGFRDGGEGKSTGMVPCRAMGVERHPYGFCVLCVYILYANVPIDGIGTGGKYCVMHV